MNFPEIVNHFGFLDEPRFEKRHFRTTDFVISEKFHNLYFYLAPLSSPPPSINLL
jgi:hypothetical protein